MSDLLNNVLEAHGGIERWHQVARLTTRLVFYFDEQFLQRRMDYLPDVTGSPIAHYTHDPKKFDGFVFYTRRRVHVRDEDGIASFDITPITIDVDSVSVDLAEGHGDE